MPKQIRWTPTSVSDRVSITLASYYGVPDSDIGSYTSYPFCSLSGFFSRYSLNCQARAFIHVTAASIHILSNELFIDNPLIFKTVSNKLRIRNIRKMRFVGHVACMREVRPT
jgi:hypothetical protein